MTFPTEPTLYQKTILSDLQGAWECFRTSLVESEGFEGIDRIMLHTSEAMSWETVRNLDLMPPLLLIIRNLCLQGSAPEEVMESLESLWSVLDEVNEARHNGEIL